MSVRFRVMGDGRVHEFEFDRDRVTVGRGPTNDVVLESACVARHQGAFVRQSDGGLVWATSAPAAFHRAGNEIDRALGDEPCEWALADGDVVRIEGVEPIAIEILTSPFTPDPRATFVDFDVPPADIGEELVALATRLARDARPAAILETFGELLLKVGVSDGAATLVVLSGADEYHNDAWAFSGDHCGPTPDPTLLLGGAASEIRGRWKAGPCVAVIGEQVLIPIGDSALEALIVYRNRGMTRETLRAVAQVAPAVRPFVQMFVARRRSEREIGAVVEENRYFRGRQRQHYLFKELVRESDAMNAVHERLRLLKNEDRPVLFAGEAGTGKELFARLLHHESERATQMIMRVNCAEFADETANVELFGTSADEDALGPRKGVFELARHGTVLLEEIDLLPPMVQAKLCRTLKEKEVRRIGESVGRPIGARVIASIHRDVSECVAEGRLRRDLYLLFRDQTVVVPSLRDRRKDILPLARKFLDVYASRYGRRVDGFSPEAEARMLDHFWPGNVRELQARVEASVLGTAGPRVGIAQLGLG